MGAEAEELAAFLDASTKRALAVAAGEAPSKRPLGAWVCVHSSSSPAAPGAAREGGGDGRPLAGPSARYGHSMTACRRSASFGEDARDALLVLGGVSAEAPAGLADGWWLDLTSMRWAHASGCDQSDKSNATAFGGRAFHSAVLWASASSVVVFGGRRRGKVLSQLCLYDLADGTWRSLQATGEAPCAREAHGAAMISSSAMAVVGGWDGQQRLADLYVLDLERMHWTRPACQGDALLPPISGHSLSVCDWQLLLAGGATPRGPSDCLYALDLVALAWRRRPCKGAARRAAHCAVALGGPGGALGAAGGPRRLFALFGHAAAPVDDADGPAAPLSDEYGGEASLSADAEVLYGAMVPSARPCYAEPIDTLEATLPEERQSSDGDGDNGKPDSARATSPSRASGPCARAYSAACAAGAASAVVFGGWDGERPLSDVWLLQLVQLQALPAPWAHPNASAEMGWEAVRARAALAHVGTAKAGLQTLAAAGMDVARLPELVDGVTLEFTQREHRVLAAKEGRRARADALRRTIAAVEAQARADAARLVEERKQLEADAAEVARLKAWAGELDAGEGEGEGEPRPPAYEGEPRPPLTPRSSGGAPAAAGPARVLDRDMAAAVDGSGSSAAPLSASLPTHPLPPEEPKSPLLAAVAGLEPALGARAPEPGDVGRSPLLAAVSALDSLNLSSAVAQMDEMVAKAAKPRE